MFEINNTACFQQAVGAKGLSEAAFGQALSLLAEPVARLKSSDLSLFQLPQRRDDLEEIEEQVQRLTALADDILVLGTGGSSLGGQTLQSLLVRGLGGLPGRPRVTFHDNIDPDSFDAYFAAVDRARLAVIAISKSGGTAETLCQTFGVADHMRQALGEAEMARRFLIVTEPKASPLKNFAERFQIACLDHDPGIGGRFSVLSNVGLLPARFCGIDPVKLREGAGEILESLLQPSAIEDAQPAIGAAIAAALATTSGLRQSVLMTYVDRLSSFGLWYRQLWAESLGKGGQGTTPIHAVGTVDQHSQLQLYLDGPQDKVFTLLRLRQSGGGWQVPEDLAIDESLGYLRGRNMGQLLDVEAKATAESLVRSGRPLREITLERLDELVLGGLLMHFMLETQLTATLMGVNPFDQPAVEEAKVLAREYLGAG